MVPKVPSISEVSITKDTLIQSAASHEDFFIFSFTFRNQFGELGFASDTDTIFLKFNDLRTDPAFTLPYHILKTPYAPLIQITDGKVDVQVSTTCCLFANNLPCTPADVFERITYEVVYDNNFGVEYPKDTISVVIDCSF